MGWVQQLNGWTVGIVLGLATTLLCTLCAVVWKKGPRYSRGPRRLWLGAQKAPLVAITAGLALLLILVGAVSTSVFLASDAHQEALPVVPSTAPVPDPTPEPTPLADGGWGPARALVSYDNRPSDATLNSMTDHPQFGDERNFLMVRLADDANASWSNNAVAVAGETYEFAVVINNDAREGGETAEGVQLRLQMPAVVEESTPGYAHISSSSTTPGAVWDGVTFVGATNGKFALRYVPGSVVLHTGGAADGTILPESVFDEGALVGCDELDGRLPAEERCESWVSFTAVLDQPNFDVGVSVLDRGMNLWLDTHVGQPGERVAVTARYENTGTTWQNDVVLRIQPPSNMHYVIGSTVLQNSTHDGISVSDALVSEDGINIGNYAPGANAIVRLEVVLDAPTKLPASQNLETFFTAYTANGSKSAPLTIVWY